MRFVNSYTLDGRDFDMGPHQPPPCSNPGRCKKPDLVPTDMYIGHGYAIHHFVMDWPERIYPLYADGYKPCSLAVRVFDPDKERYRWGCPNHVEGV